MLTTAGGVITIASANFIPVQTDDGSEAWSINVVDAGGLSASITVTGGVGETITWVTNLSVVQTP